MCQVALLRTRTRRARACLRAVSSLAPSNDNASFFMPGIGFPTEESEEEESALSVVDEEEETEEEERLSPPADDDDMFGKDMGGIRIIFTPPQEEEVPEERKQIQLCSPTKRTSPPPMLPLSTLALGRRMMRPMTTPWMSCHSTLAVR